MRIAESCAKCLFDKQKNKNDNAEYLARIKDILDNRKDEDTSPYMVYLFNKVHEEMFGESADYSKIKKKYNDLALSMEADLRNEIKNSRDPLNKALLIARIGNYIDFGAMNHVDKNVFFQMFTDPEKTNMRPDELTTYDAFLKKCEAGKNFLLICDNCGEVVFDKLMLEALKERFPHLNVTAMVRGAEVLNDATMEDAEYVGLNKVAKVVSNGDAVAGTIYNMLSEEAQNAVDEADIILAKGQGNYESMSGQGFNVFYEFLCKCDLFTGRFGVEKLTGMFIEES